MKKGKKSAASLFSTSVGAILPKDNFNSRDNLLDCWWWHGSGIQMGRTTMLQVLNYLLKVIVRRINQSSRQSNPKCYNCNMVTFSSVHLWCGNISTTWSKRLGESTHHYIDISWVNPKEFTNSPARLTNSTNAMGLIQICVSLFDRIRVNEYDCYGWPEDQPSLLHSVKVINGLKADKSMCQT